MARSRESCCLGEMRVRYNSSVTKTCRTHVNSILMLCSPVRQREGGRVARWRLDSDDCGCGATHQSQSKTLLSMTVSI